MKGEISKRHKQLLATLGLYLRELRISYGLTQESLHVEVGISRRSLIDMEKGRSKNLLHILRLSDFYDIDTSDILKFDR